MTAQEISEHSVIPTKALKEISKTLIDIGKAVNVDLRGRVKVFNELASPLEDFVSELSKNPPTDPYPVMPTLVK